MIQDDVLKMLGDVYDRLLSVYPFPEGSDVDPRLAMAIGYAAGAIREGLDAVRDDRPVRFANKPDSLDGIALRVRRDGRWQSLFIAELAWLTDAEIAALNWAPMLLALLEADDDWRHSLLLGQWMNSACRR